MGIQLQTFGGKGGSGGDEVEAVCTYDTKDAAEGDKVLLNKNVAQEGQCYQSFAASSSSDSCPFLSADGMRAVLRNGVYIRNGERFRLVSENGFYVRAEFPNGGILKFVSGTPDKFVYCKKDDELGYIETTLSIETQTNGEKDSDTNTLVSGNGQYVFVKANTFAKLYKASYDESGEVTGFEEVVFELNANSDLYNGFCFVKGAYAYCNTKQSWKLYEITGLSAAYVKNLGSYGDFPAVMGDIVLTQEGWVDISDPLNPVYTSNDWWPGSTASSMDIFVRQDKAYYITMGGSPYCAVKWTGQTVSVLKSSNSDYVMAGGTEGDFVAVRLTSDNGQRIGFSKVDDDLNVLEDYSSPKMGAAAVPVGYFLADNDGNLYNYNTEKIWQHTAAQGLVETGTLPEQTGSSQTCFFGLIHGQPAYSSYQGKITRLNLYPDNTVWTATGNTNYKGCFNNAGYFLNTYGAGGKFAADGTYTVYTKSGSSMAGADNPVCLGSGNFGFCMYFDDHFYMCVFDDETQSVTMTGKSLPFDFDGNYNKMFITPDDKYLLVIDTRTAVVNVVRLNDDTSAPEGDALYPSAMQPVINKQVVFCDMTLDGTLVLWHADGSIRTFKYNNGMDIMDIQEVDLGLPLPAFTKAATNDRLFFSTNMRFVCVNKVSDNTQLFIDRQEETSAYAYKAERYRGNNFASGTLTGIVSEAPVTGADGQKTVKVKTILPEENI